MVVIGIPYHPAKGYAQEHLFHWLSKVDYGMLMEYHDGEFGREGAVTELRRSLCRRASVAGADHIMFVGADTIPPEGAVERLLSHGLDAVSGVYYSRQNWNCAVAWHPDDPYWNQRCRLEVLTGLEQVGGFGLDCVLLSRRAYELYAQVPVGGSDDGPFCEALKRNGIGLWLDCAVVARHYLTVGVYH